MIGKGKSISHTLASMQYGWNQEKNAEVIFSQNLVGNDPKEISKEFQRIQELNHNCNRNTLSFVLSPTIEDGKLLRKEEMEKLVKDFLIELKLGERQAIAFVHRDKDHTHIHLYVNRIDFEGKAYNDSFIGKQSQRAAEKVAEINGLTTVKQVQHEISFNTSELRKEIHRRHELTLKHMQPKNLKEYVEGMRSNGVKMEPSINRQGELQGYRYHFDGQSFKGSEVHRSMSLGNLGKTLLKEHKLGVSVPDIKKVRAVSGGMNLATTIAKKIVKTVIKKAIDQGIGF